MARLSYGKWFVPPQHWEKNLLQGYLNKVEGMVKPDEKPIDLETEKGVEEMHQRVRKLD